MNALVTRFASLPFVSRNIASMSALLCLMLMLWFIAPPLVRAQPGASAMAVVPNQAEARALKMDESVERELAGGEQHAYQITLSTGQFLKVIVEQRGIDLSVVLIGPNDKQLFEFNRESRYQGQELVSWVAETSGTYRFNIRPITVLPGNYQIRVTELREATTQDRALQEAYNLRREALSLANRDNKEAIRLAERSLKILEEIFGSAHSEFATGIRMLARIIENATNYQKAELLLQQALAIKEKALGPNHNEVATILNDLGNNAGYRDDEAKAEEYYLRALEVREKAVGKEHPDYGTALHNLGLYYFQARDYAKAEVLYRQSLSVTEKSLGPDHEYVARNRDNLALAYYQLEDYTSAESLMLRALATWEKIRGKDSPQVAISLNNLASLYSYKGDDEKAESIYIRVRDLWEKAYGPEHFNLALVNVSLGEISRKRSDYEKAEQFYLRARAIKEKFDKKNATVTAADVLVDLARLNRERGDYKQALELCQKALEQRQQKWGMELGGVGVLPVLSHLFEAQGQIDEAVATQARAAESIEKYRALNLTAGSERQKAAYLESYLGTFNRTVSLHVRSAPNNPIARQLALTNILQQKGRALDALADTLSVLRKHADSQDRELLNQYQKTVAELAQLTLTDPRGMTAEQRSAQIKSLEEKKEQIESELSRRSMRFRTQAQPVTLAAVQLAIPTEAALVEIAIYRPFDAKATKTKNAYGLPRYVAYVIRREGEAQWVELGETKTIDEAVEKLRQALRDKQRADVKQLARAVDDKVMRPVRALLGKTRRLLVAPDGALSLIPFAALVDERGRYLVQHYEFSYLTSGRDLLRLEVKQSSKQRALVVANPDFGESAGETKSTQRGLALIYKPAAEAAAADRFSLADAYFPPLSGTAGEAVSLKAMLGDATVLTQAQATEAALKQVSGPNLLHIATHGFFLEALTAGEGEGRELKKVSTAAEQPANQRIENPLLRSGLALAGANLHKSGDDDGILTAQEAAGLDLWGTKLVVLSACDTGVGEVKNGEGVYGLRRALVLAGSETQVMSLWPVSDKGTRDLMIEYYRRLLRGEGRSAALRQVQLQMIRVQAVEGAAQDRLLVKKGPAEQDRILSSARKQTAASKDYSHPYYWASFIQSGEWANLNGKR